MQSILAFRAVALAPANSASIGTLLFTVWETCVREWSRPLGEEFESGTVWRMRRNTALFELIVCVVVCLPLASVAQKSTGNAVLALEKKWTQAYKERQIDILSSLLSDEFIITVEDGSTYGKEGYITHTADTSVRVQIAELSDLRVRMHGNTAVVTGAYHEKGQSKGKDYEYHDRLTDVWMDVGGKWQVIASHYSVPLKE
jgi:ketosteroid isomerase-like protein